MTARSFEEEFRGSARFLPHMLDVHRDRVLVVMMTEADYRRASFLDQRILTPDGPREWMHWSDLEGFAGHLPDRASFIFHIGHVGSTLVSRLLGELPTVLALREPLLLRSLAELHAVRGRPECPWAPQAFPMRLATTLGWLSRSFRLEQSPIVKATSFVSELAPSILKPERRCLFLCTPARTYLETIFAGAASLQEVAVLSGARLVRLHGRIGEEPWRLWQLSLGERVAMAWACEMTALEQASAGAPAGDVLWLDFEDFLEAPAPRLIDVATHFREPLSGSVAAGLVSGPIMKSYSKAPEQSYSRELRTNVLAAAREEHGQEIGLGLMWLERAAARYPLVAKALSRGGL